MKKVLVVLAMIAMFAMMFAGCAANDSKVGTCDLCGESDVNVRGITYEGETGYFCDGCYDSAQALVDLAQQYQ